MKRKPDRDIDLMARGPSFERAAWLGNMLRMADRKEIADPTDDDIQEMREAIGDDPTFEKLSDANKTLLFSAMLTIRQRLQIYDELVKFEEEEPGPLLSALTGIVATIPNYHGLLSVAADEMSEIRGITVRRGVAEDNRVRQHRKIAAGDHSEDFGQAKSLRQADSTKPEAATRSHHDPRLP